MRRPLRHRHGAGHVRPVRLLLLLLAGGCTQLAAVEPPTAATPLTAFALNTSGVLSAPAPEVVPGPAGEWLATSLAGTVPAQCEGGAALADGDLLIGWPISLQAGVLTLASGSFGTLQIPAAQVSSVIISAVCTGPGVNRSRSVPRGTVG